MSATPTGTATGPAPRAPRPGRTAPPAGSAAAPGRTGPFTGWLTLTRLAARRDRVLVPVWLAVFVLTAASTAASTLGVYPTEASRREMATTINTTTALRALYGPVFDEGSAGAVSLFKMGTLGAALVALLGIVLTVRHTRAEEETGRLELLGAGVVGRYASLAAAMTLVTATNAVLALLVAGSLVAAGLSVTGSLAFGVSWALAGVSFAAVAAVAAQLTTVARAATGLSSTLLGLTYLLRAVADTGDGGERWLTWLSPVGWSQQLRPYAGDRWWVAVISLGFTALTTTCAFVLAGHRDLGAGALPERPGPATAGRALTGPAALALRLHRGTLLTWAGAFLVLGWVLGGIVSNIGDALTSDAAREMVTRLGGSGSLVDAYLATVLSFIGVGVSAFGVGAVLRLRGEEASGHTDPLLATPVTRHRLIGSHLVVALGGSVLLLLLAGLVAGASTATGTGEGERFGQVLTGALVQLPAVFVVVGITTAAVGLVPRYSAAVGWGVLVAFLLLGEVGPLIRLKQWIMDLSPYAHTPRVPSADVTAAPLVWLTLLAAALLAVGVVAFRYRDVE